MTGGQKSEYATSLSGAAMVSKAHGRIAFRGIIDTLEAEVIEAQVLAAGLGGGTPLPDPAGPEYCGYLGEILDYLRNIMSAEVNETPLPPPFLFGMDAEEIRRASHAPLQGKACCAALLPSHTQGPLAARLNTLRAKVREAELLAVRVFAPRAVSCDDAENSGDCQREDIILALNRLSSALWLLYCKYVSR